MPDFSVSALVVDDTVLYRKVLKDVLSEIPNVDVLGTASNGKNALAKIEYQTPDFITLDFEMPEMDGLETLKHLRKDFPDVAVIMISAHTKQGADVTLKALELGAYTFVTKPEEANPLLSKDFLLAQLTPIIQSITLKKARASSRIATRKKPSDTPPTSTPPPSSPSVQPGKIKIVAIGISTGGPNALLELIPKLPQSFLHPIVLVQHMPPHFTLALAESLDNKSAIKVVEGADKMELVAGQAYIAPGGKQMKVVERQSKFYLEVNNDPPENHCQPAADYLFRSVAEVFKNHALGVIMTGMGCDGTSGLKCMKAKGAQIIAQNEESCVVFGMPAEAINAGVTDMVLPLTEIAGEIIKRANK